MQISLLYLYKYNRNNEFINRLIDLINELGILLDTR